MYEVSARQEALLLSWGLIPDKPPGDVSGPTMHEGCRDVDVGR